MIKKSLDAIPQNAILKNVAFEKVVKAYALKPRRNTAHASTKNASERGLGRKMNEDETFAEAEIVLRHAITEGHLTAYVRDPRTQELLKLSPTGWLGGIDGMEDEFEEPNKREPTGADGSIIDGKLRPVFFLTDEFESWFKGNFYGPTRKKRFAPSREAAKRVIRELDPNGEWEGLDKVRKDGVLRRLVDDGIKATAKTVERAFDEIKKGT